MRNAIASSDELALPLSVSIQPKAAALGQRFNIGSQVEVPHLTTKEAHRPQCAVGHYPCLGVAR
jgi:hypothetical protein